MIDEELSKRFTVLERRLEELEQVIADLMTIQERFRAEAAQLAE